MNKRFKLFQKYCDDKGYKHTSVFENNLYNLEIVFPSSNTIKACSVNMDQALDIIKKKLQEKLNNKGK